MGGARIAICPIRDRYGVGGPHGGTDYAVTSREKGTNGVVPGRPSQGPHRQWSVVEVSLLKDSGVSLAKRFGLLLSALGLTCVVCLLYPGRIISTGFLYCAGKSD